MKKIILMCLCANLLICQLYAQSLAPKVIASAGGFQSNAAGSLSYTIGESVTHTVTSGSNMLTQGFQQSFELNLLNVKAFLQGYYVGSGQMNDVLFNQGEYASPSLITDSITVELHNATSPFALAFQTKTLIKQNGDININGLGTIGQSYYIVLKHRNSIETWSANPVIIVANTFYDFTSAANKAYGNNLNEMQPGVFACYSGDINQDGNIDLLDASFLEVDINNFEFGYFITDINGDGNVDLVDLPILENNINAFIYAIHP